MVSMKLAITFFGIVAAGLTTLVSPVISSVAPKHISGTYLPEPRGLHILTPRGTDGSNRKPTLGAGPSKQQSTDKSPSENSSKKTSTNDQTQKQPSSQRVPTLHGEEHSSIHDNASPPARKPQGQSRPSTSLNGLDRPGAPDLMRKYLQQHQEEQRSAESRYLATNNRAPQLLNWIDRAQDSLPVTRERITPQQEYALASDTRLLLMARNAAERNAFRYQAQEHERNRDHVGWGGVLIPQSSPHEGLAPEVHLGPNGFPNTVVHSPQTGAAPHVRASHNPSQHLGPRDMANGMGSPSLHLLNSRANVQAQHPADPPRARRVPIGGPSGTTIRPRPTLEERLAWVAGPSRAAPEARQRIASQSTAGRIQSSSTGQASSGREAGGSEQASQSTRATNPSHSSPFWTIQNSSSMSSIASHRSRHPLLNSLPGSIVGSVTPGSSRSPSPRPRRA